MRTTIGFPRSRDPRAVTMVFMRFRRLLGPDCATRRRAALFLASALTLSFAFLLQPELAQARDFVVNSSVDKHDSNDGDGSCNAGRDPNRPECTLRAAIEEANVWRGPDTIVLPQGTYALTLGSLQILENLTLRGAGAQDTLIDGGCAAKQDRTTVPRPEDNCRKRVLVIGSDLTGDRPAVTVAGITIKRGFATDFGGGGIIMAPGSVLELVESIVSENHVTNGRGAGILNDQGVLVLRGSHVQKNVQLSSLRDIVGRFTTAGGIMNVSGRLLIDRSTITGNRAESGGGIQTANSASQVEILDSRISDNVSLQDGGGILQNVGRVVISNSTITGNKATDGLFLGGIRFGGGGIVTYGPETPPFLANLEINASTISGNEAPTGGGIFQSRGRVEISNSTISGNVAASGFVGAATGGGLRTISGIADIRASTITNNRAQSGGGLHNGTGGQVNMGKTILAGNNRDLPGAVGRDCFSKEQFRFTSFRSNLVGVLDQDCLLQDTIFGDTRFDEVNVADPGLGPLSPDNGGPTRTHALLAGSPAIDAASFGSSATFFDCLDVDQRGVTRPQSGDATGEAVCDIGAFELPPAGQFILTVQKRGGGDGTVIGPGIDCGLDCGESYAPGTPVPLQAAAAEDSRFAGWEGACSGTEACVVAMDAAKTVVATFQTSLAGGGERLTNPGFEDGLAGWTLQPWMASVAAVQTGTVHSGARAFQFSGKQRGPSLSQDVAAQAGETVTASGWVNVTASNTGMDGVIELVAVNVNRGAIKTFPIHKISGTTAGWQQVALTQLIPTGTVSVRLQARFPSLNGTVFLDDFSIR